MILAIDPGETAGWATLTNEGDILDMGQVKKDDFNAWLNRRWDEVDHLIAENFKIRPGINFSWNEMITIQMIGAIRFRSYQLGITLTMQEPSVFSIGVRWAGATMPKNHDMSHQFSALGHAVFYSHKTLHNPIPAIKKMQESP